MMQYWSHFKYVVIHKYFVFLECCKRGIIWRGIMHDMSKFSPSEFGAYANCFFNGDGTRKERSTKKEEIVAFERAWCHHGHRNDHHWTYWKIGTHYTMSEESMVMPTVESIKEMAADMVGANAAQGNPNPYEGAKKFYSENRHCIILHPDARSLLEKELCIND